MKQAISIVLFLSLGSFFSVAGMERSVSCESFLRNSREKSIDTTLKVVHSPLCPRCKNVTKAKKALAGLEKIEEMFEGNAGEVKDGAALLEKLLQQSSMANVKYLILLQLAECYRTGTGKQKNLEEAQKYYKEILDKSNNPYLKDLASKALLN